MEIYDKRIKDLTGKRFSKLTVLEFVGVRYHEAQWLCECDCGNKTTVSGRALRRGSTKSCGCYNTEKATRHGMKYTRLYEKWNHMLERCRNPKNPSYNRYGGRGISVCDEWKESFENFRDWALNNGYDDSLSIDRIDVNGNYCPENCKFSNAKEQANNRTSNRFIEYNGKTKTLAQWADETGIRASTIAARIDLRGWSVEKALTTPVKGVI